MFNDFRFRVAFRVVLLGLVMALFVFMVSRPNMIFAAGLTCLIIVGQLIELYRFTSQTNRKLTRFLESVKYSDFLSGFANDNKLGKSFRELNTAFNEVLEAFLAEPRKVYDDLTAHPEVVELDLNPVFAGADGTVAVDWLMVRSK